VKIKRREGSGGEGGYQTYRAFYGFVIPYLLFYFKKKIEKNKLPSWFDYLIPFLMNIYVVLFLVYIYILFITLFLFLSF